MFITKSDFHFRCIIRPDMLAESRNTIYLLNSPEDHIPSLNRSYKSIRSLSLLTTPIANVNFCQNQYQKPDDSPDEKSIRQFG